jgi:Protein of unknown function (DUF2799)
MRRMNFLAATAVLQLAGCAGMDQSECQFSDWRAVGYEDGSQGRSSEAFGQYRRNCAEHEVTADFQAYQAGRESGLKEYCQQSRGFHEGSQGHTYAGVCPADTEIRFLEGYHAGRTLYDLESALDATNQRIAADEARIRQIELELTDKMSATLADATTRDARARLLVETKQLAEERATLTREIKDLQAKRRQQEKQLADAREELVAKR